MSWPTDQALINDLISASQFNRLPVALAEATGAATFYDFTNIPQHWTHLMLVCSLKGNSGANLDFLWLRPNNDGGGNYYPQRMRGLGTTATVTEYLAVSIGRIAEISGRTSGGFSSTAIFIPDYSIAKNHGFVSLFFSAFDTGTGSLVVGNFGFLHVNSNPITRLVVGIEGGSSFVADSIVTMYGMGQV
jgi:hypothetical protein